MPAVASLVLHACWHPLFVFPLLSSCAVNCLGGLILERVRASWLVGILVAANIFLLGVFGRLVSLVSKSAYDNASVAMADNNSRDGHWKHDGYRQPNSLRIKRDGANA